MRDSSGIVRWAVTTVMPVAAVLLAPARIAAAPPPPQPPSSPGAPPSARAPATTDSAVGDLSLQWRAPPGCPTHADVLARVERYRVSSAEGTAVRGRVLARGEVEVDSESSTLHLLVEVGDGVLERHLAVSSCELAASVTALTIAVALDPEGVLEGFEQRASSEDDASSPHPEAAADAVGDPAPQAAPDHATRPRLGLGLRGGASVGGGDLPHVGVGVRGAFALRWRPRGRARDRLRHGPDLVFDWLAPVESSLDPARDDASAGSVLGPDARAVLGRWSVGARECIEPTLGAVSLPLCLGVDVGSLRAQGRGLPETRANSQMLVALAYGWAVRARVARRLALVVGVEGAFHLYRPVFQVEGYGVVRETPVGAVRLHLGLEMIVRDERGRWRPRR